MPRSVTSLDFSFIVIDDTNAEVDVSDYYVSFSFDHGANSSRTQPPGAFESSGTLVLDNESGFFNFGRLNSYKSFILRSATYTYFDLIVLDYDRRTDERDAVLHLAGRSSAKRQDGIEYVNRPGAGMGTPTVQEIITDVFPEATFGRVWALQVPGRFELTGSVPAPAIEFTRQSMIRAFENSGSVVVLERCNTDEPELFVTRLPLDIADEDGYTITPQNSALVRRGYKEARTTRWQARRWEALLAAAAWSVKSTTVTSLRMDTTPNSTSTTIQFYDLPAGMFGNNLEPAEWGGFLPNQTAGNWSHVYLVTVPGSFTFGPITIGENYLRFRHSFRGSRYGVEVTFSAGFAQYYKTTNVGSPTRKVFTADEPTESQRVLPANRLALLNEGADGSYTVINDVIDAWAAWDALWATMAILPDALHEGEARSVTQRRPGDVVNISAQGISHRCMITRVGWQMRGINPLSVTWTAITLDRLERPAVMFMGVPVVRGVPVERIA